MMHSVNKGFLNHVSRVHTSALLQVQHYSNAEQHRLVQELKALASARVTGDKVLEISV